jgi:hypothetical protein
MEEYTCNVYTKDYTKCDSAPKTLWEKRKFTRVAKRPEKMKQGKGWMIPSHSILVTQYLQDARSSKPDLDLESSSLLQDSESGAKK